MQRNTVRLSKQFNNEIDKTRRKKTTYFYAFIVYYTMFILSSIFANTSAPLIPSSFPWKNFTIFTDYYCIFDILACYLSIFMV